MRSPWYIVVRGNASDLARVKAVADRSSELSLKEEVPSEWRFRSATVEPHHGPEDARSDLEDLVIRLADVAAVAAKTGSGRRPSTWSATAMRRLPGLPEPHFR